jgi:hypothetical protein
MLRSASQGSSNLGHMETSNCGHLVEKHLDHKFPTSALTVHEKGYLKI